ncbi:MAG: flagellar hook-basal body complex protein FliE [Rhodobacteraceae bacterium]|nr:flagellar hook-basal body complex protein FliE [Paracoccaceae bacterium]
MTNVSAIKSLQSVASSQQSALSKAENVKQQLSGQNVNDMSGPAFNERLEGALNSVAKAQNNAAQSVMDYETGKTENLAKVMVDQQISSLGFQMTLNVRNKALSAYKEIMNMPV